MRPTYRQGSELLKAAPYQRPLMAEDRLAVSRVAAIDLNDHATESESRFHELRDCDMQLASF